jgi:fructose-bisphosphate aldolase / 2-amino-3,7-dideoxy-D-threo-hept-6-ulosonate synthase
MGSLGKELRLRRLIRPDTGRCILFAASHGTGASEIYKELEDTPAQVDAALSGGADCVLISCGFAEAAAAVFGRFPTKGFVAKVSATSYVDVPREIVSTSVERAAFNGADAVGLLMQLTPATEREVLAMVAEFGEQCSKLGMPYVVEAEVPGAYGGKGWFPEDVVSYLRRSCRLAQELGADIIKTNWPGSAEGYAEVIAAVSKPTVVAGGPLVAEDALLAVIEGALSAGAAGCSVGRNIFQAPDPRAMAERIATLVHTPALLTV